MKFVAAIILTSLLGYAAPLYFPWWSFAFTSLVVAVVVKQRSARSFIAGFLGLFLLWGIHAYIIDNANEHILSQKVASILPLGGSSALLILITAILGGLVSGFAALTGNLAWNSKNYLLPKH